MSNQVEQIKQINQLETALKGQVLEMTKMGITFPKGYDPQKAVINAVDVIKQDTKLMGCTPASIGQSIKRMVNLGLDVSAKQCYFIPYSGVLQLSPSYFGTQTILRRIKGIVDINAQVIFEADDFDYEIENSHIKNVEHKSSFKNRKNGIAGAYAIIDLDPEIFGRSQHIEVMDIEEIKKSWGQGATKGSSPAHKNFPGEMAKKSVINRAAKNFINTLTDSDNVELANNYNAVVEGEYDNSTIKIPDTPPEQIQAPPMEPEYDPMADLPDAMSYTPDVESGEFDD